MTVQESFPPTLRELQKRNRALTYVYIIVFSFALATFQTGLAVAFHAI